MVSLKVFQCQPLVRKVVSSDGTVRAVMPSETLDLSKEEKELKKIFEGTNVNVSFEPATFDNIFDFLSKGNNWLHWSGHNAHGHLLHEDGCGEGKLLPANKLEEWIQIGGENLFLVFVSACHSRSAGDAFFNAGVPYVVCSKSDDALIIDDFALEFARRFYTVLATGENSVERAFEKAQGALKVNSTLEELAASYVNSSAQVEAEKFVLLKRDVQADLDSKFLSGFRTSLMSPYRQDSVYFSKASLPAHPLVIGREVVMHQILEALKKQADRRLVTIKGQRGLGKVTMAKALAHYIQKRNWGQVFWIESKGNNDRDVKAIWKQLLEMMGAFADEDYYSIFHEKDAIFVVDATKFSEEGAKTMSSFLEDVFNRTNQVRVILVQHSDGVPINTVACKVPKQDCELEPLHEGATVELFSRFCPYSAHIWRGYKLHFTGRLHTKMREVLLKVMGEGIPKRIFLMANTISQQQFSLLSDGDPNNLSIDDFKETLEKLGSSNPRTNEEVLVHFSKREPRIYKKIVSAFARKAERGEHIHTTVNGQPATENKVKDDSSWVICGKVVYERYPLDDQTFRANYYVDNPKPISAESSFGSFVRMLTGINDSRYEQLLHNEGFKEYKSRRKVKAWKVTKEDMLFFHHGSEHSGKETYFWAPWGTLNRVECGDYVATQLDEKDGVYRIEKSIFKGSYREDEEDDEQSKWSTILQVTTFCTIVLIATASFSRKR